VSSGVWESVTGGIEHIVKDDGKRWAVISLWGYNQDGQSVGVRTEIVSERLQANFGRTMDFAVQDLQRHGLL
jgi:hypothetical protein